MYLDGKVAYCAQSPWIQNMSLRGNIVGKEDEDGAPAVLSPDERKRYDTVLKVCALGPDVAQFKAGDGTLIGDRGINLSGGQKARVSLARAVYAPSDVVILDDIISAVDAHVARHITKSLLTGFLREEGEGLYDHWGHSLVKHINYKAPVERCEEGGGLHNVHASVAKYVKYTCIWNMLFVTL